MTRNQPEGGLNSKPATIVYMIDHIWSGGGGTEGQLLQLISGLDRRRFDPRLVVLYDRSDFLHSGDLPCSSRCLGLVSGRQIGYWSALGRLATALRNDTPSLLHTVFPESVTIGPWLARVAGVPHVTWRRDLGFWLTPAKQRLLRWGSRWTSQCIANSEAVRSQVIEAEGFAPDRVLVVRNTVDLDELAAVEPVDVHAALNLSPGTVCLVLPANLRPVKGGEIALRALARARAAGAALHLISIGENSGLLENYKRLCADLQITDNVSFLGHQSRSDLLRWVKGSDITLSASFSEGYSNSNVEAMLLARPLIATAVGGNQEQVLDGKTGFLVSPGDPEAMAAAILQLAFEPELRLAQGEAGASRMRSLHGMNQTVQRHEELYHRVRNVQRMGHAG